MNSTQLGRYGKFSFWYPFEKQTIQKEAPKDTGVYIIRTMGGRPFGRFQGESDILYIGSTTSKGGLKRRLQQYFSPGSIQWTNLRINEFAKKYPMEVAWCCGVDEPKNFEHELLRQYLEEHDELPPFNHANIRKLYKNAPENFKLADSFSYSKI
jgi:hypothetical protein